MSLIRAHDVLRSVFGYESFRGQQSQVIEHLIAGGNALVLMPTGGGKSLCFQIPAIIRPGVAIVVSPLIALMQDQVDSLLELGVRAAYSNSSMSFDKMKEVEKRLLKGDLDLLYVAPERLLNPTFLELLKKAPIALFAIDEAHCLSQWGHDFRPEYGKLTILPELFPKIPRIALTATADEMTKAEIIERLDLKEAPIFATGFDRPNIHYQIVEKNNPKKQLLDFLQSEHGKDAGIVYCLSRKKVEDTAQWLKSMGLDALPYHAGLSARDRQKNQEYFLRHDGVIMVATIAFGMGIDKPNVRFVAHLDLPKSIESYYQETGRAGRDGLPAQAWMAYGLQDVIIQKEMVAQSNQSSARKLLEKQKLEALLGLCETTSCRRQVLLSYFKESYPNSCQNCDTCLNPITTFNATEAARQALSCVYRTGQHFGVAHLVDVLIGKDTEKVIRFDHHRLSVFGIGKAHPGNHWQSIFRQLISKGLLNIDMEKFGALKLSASSTPVLKGQTEVYLRPLTAKKSSSSRNTPQEKRGPTSSPLNQTLFEALKLMRLDLANKMQVPPYVIFHDRTLIEIAQKKPASIHELKSIHGVGEHKLEKYGETLLALIEKVELGQQGQAV